MTAVAQKTKVLSKDAFIKVSGLGRPKAGTPLGFNT